MKKIAIIMGSDSDLPVAEKGIDVLKKLGMSAGKDFEVRVMSAHRTPEAVLSFAASARENNFGVIIAIAGKAAHLAGFIASQTRLPVIGVPVKGSDLGGLDALLSTAQMPPGVPVATVGIDGTANAAWLAARILALADPDLAAKLEDEACAMAESVAKKDQAVQAKFN